MKFSHSDYNYVDALRNILSLKFSESPRIKSGVLPNLKLKVSRTLLYIEGISLSHYYIVKHPSTNFKFNLNQILLI
jgi:hypothetical protein